MKNILGPVLLSLALFVSSCTKRSAPGDDVPTVSQDNSSTDEADNDDFQLDENKTTQLAEEQTIEVPEKQEVLSEVKSELKEEESVVTTSPALLAPTEEKHEQKTLPSPPVTTKGELREYVVTKDDTLMLVAFKIYGDYKKWKSIKKLNHKVIGSQNGPLNEGLVLKYRAPAQEYVQQANGEPYIILHKDTLGKISKKVYSTPKRWQAIWKNNPYIIDPNIIFAGFTVYYVKDDSVASK